ncbi:MAG: hypothetical protein RIR00_445 [Pseudomonadota bacterium]|jgi:class 3 adenylate cyclase
MNQQGRELAVLVADIAGRNRVAMRLGETEAGHAIDRCIKRIERAIEGSRGLLVRSEQDRIIAIFPAAEDACLSGVEMQQRVADLPPVSGVKLSLRAGFAFGLVNESSYGVSGVTAQQAAQLAERALTGQVVTNRLTVAKLNPTLAQAARPASGEHPAESPEQEPMIVWHQPQVGGGSSKPAVAPAVAPPGKRLCLRYKGKACLVDERSPTLTMGRDLSNFLIVEDRKASRIHARLEYRNGRFLLVDQSTNGSYVSQGNEAEAFIWQAELELTASGSLCFGEPSDHTDSDPVDFEFL